MYDNLALFVDVVEAGSFKAASKRNDIPSSTIGRRIKTLEADLSCKLLNRNSHTFEMTREGRKLYDKVNYHVSALDSAVKELRDDVSGNKGHIKLLAPTNLFSSIVKDPLSNYLKDNANIELELELSNAMANFYSSNADIAIRVGKQEDSDLTQVKIGTIQTVLVASPSYLVSVGSLVVPQDLDKHSTIVTEPLTVWDLYQNEVPSHTTYMPNNKRIKLNDLLVSKQLTMKGLGISLLPITEVCDELKTGELQRVLPNWQGKDRDVYIIWHRRQLLSTRAAKLVDYLKSHLSFE
ncbi:LysR family transcriptional regulator [Vibrio sonorensis]|uniref:LysR family transcriptional regulator n=1 Tax=Vibrio sonorensis TaxID=1004316 RepID=UPI0008D94E73|nr:LysR family transcriptional regulator [Vibrio sonorensis]